MTEIEKEREKVAIIVSEPGSQVAESSTYILIYNKIGRKRRKKRGYKISISLRRTWYGGELPFREALSVFGAI
ncbi:hypothetical protein ACMSEY_17595 [Bacteroides thetaiotaomicron]|uniref:hypothetical protein n=1 Tax=Bacteroides thetaiotaomicron TaxID=818 RepID=UPI0039C13123